MADFHRREATAGFSWMASEYGASPEQLVQGIRDCEREPATWQLIRETPLDGSDSSRYVWACYHQILADRYQRAVYRPWQIVSQAE